jgi:putative addiction module component (TIGR02574 family)
MQTDLDQLRKLPLADKLRIVEQLWDDIGESEELLLVRDWHKEEAQRRSMELESQPNSAVTRDELWKRVAERDG